MGVFPPGGCRPVVAGGLTGAAAPLPCTSPRESLCSSTCRCYPIPSVTVRRGPQGVLLPVVGLVPKFHPTGLEWVNLQFSGVMGWGWTGKVPTGRTLDCEPGQ